MLTARKTVHRKSKTRCRFCTKEGCPRPAFVDYKDVAGLKKTGHRPGQAVQPQAQRAVRDLSAGRGRRGQAGPLHGPAAVRRRVEKLEFSNPAELAGFFFVAAVIIAVMDISQAFAAAVERHQAGDLAAAESQYRAILSQAAGPRRHALQSRRAAFDQKQLRRSREVLFAMPGRDAGQCGRSLQLRQSLPPRGPVAGSRARISGLHSQ